MDWLLQIGLSNAVAAAVLAVPAALVGLCCRRPALAHGLWLLVLLKLITPPIWELPIALGSTPPELIAAESPPTAHEPDPSLNAEATVERAIEQDAAVATLGPGELIELLPPPAADEQLPEMTSVEQPPPAAVDEPPTEVVAATLPPLPPSWETAAACGWLGGTLWWFTFAGLRVWRFHRFLRLARPPSPELQRQIKKLTAKLSLTRSPEIRLLPGRVSPMLWALANRRFLLLPAELLDRLTEDQRATLLTHELAHLRRCDHWVRGLEFLVTGLYWWHPVVWWARRELREAEEQCCDAWVVWTLPAAAKAYALALVETVDFLSEARPVLPPVASGIGHVHTLKRRLTMIMRGTTPRALTWGGLVAVLGLATTLLPLSPSWAQPDPRGGEPRRDNIQEQKRRAEEAVKRAEADRQRALEELRRLETQERDDVRAREVDARARFDQEREAIEWKKARDEVMELGRTLKAMRAELDAVQQKVRVAEQRFKEAFERLEGIRGRGDGRGSPATGRPGGGAGTGGTSGPPGTGVPGRGPGVGAGGAPSGQPGGRMGGPDDRGRPGGGAGFGGGPGFGGGGGMRGGGAGAMMGGGRGAPDQERRLQELERKVDQLLREIEGLRRDLRGGRPGAGGGGGRGGAPGGGGGGPGGPEGAPGGGRPGSDRPPNVPGDGPRADDDTALFPVSPNSGFASSLFQEHSMDFGQVKKGTKVSHRFKIANGTKRAVHIAGVRTSAGFITAKTQKTELQPGQETSIEVQVDTSRFVGDKTALVYVALDRPTNDEAKLSLRVESIAPAVR